MSMGLGSFHGENPKNHLNHLRGLFQCWLVTNFFIKLKAI